MACITAAGIEDDPDSGKGGETRSSLQTTALDSRMGPLSSKRMGGGRRRSFDLGVARKSVVRIVGVCGEGVSEGGIVPWLCCSVL